MVVQAMRAEERVREWGGRSDALPSATQVAPAVKDADPSSNAAAIWELAAAAAAQIRVDSLGWINMYRLIEWSLINLYIVPEPPLNFFFSPNSWRLLLLRFWVEDHTLYLGPFFTFQTFLEKKI